MPPSSSFDLSIPKALWAFLRSIGSQGTSGNAGKLLGISGADAASVTPFSATPGAATVPVADSGGHLTDWVPTFTGDSGTGGAIGLVPAPAAGDAVAGKILGANGEWVNQAQVGRTFYLDPSDSSDLATYKTALTVPSTNVETTLTATLTGTTKSLAAVFATDPNIPAITQLPPGTYTRHFHVATGGVSEVARLYVEIYTCASDGSSETLRRSGYTPEFSGTTVQEVSSSAEDASGYAMAVTDRLLFKVYWERVSGPANCDVTVYFNGSSRAAYVGSTILAALVVGTTAGTVCAGNDSRLATAGNTTLSPLPSITAMPLALTEQTATRIYLDMAGRTQFRLCGYIASAAPASATLRLRYSLDNGGTWAEVGSSDGRLAIDATGAFASQKVAIAAGAQASALFSIWSAGGDGIASPSITMVQVQAW